MSVGGQRVCWLGLNLAATSLMLPNLFSIVRLAGVLDDNPSPGLAVSWMERNEVPKRPDSLQSPDQV